MPLGEGGLVESRLIVSQDPVESRRDGIRCLHCKRFLEELWGGQLLRTEGP